MSVENDNWERLAKVLDLDPKNPPQTVLALIAGETGYLGDAYLNLQAIKTSEHLDEKESTLIAYACALSVAPQIADIFKKDSEKSGATPAETGEMAAISSLMGFNNIFYRFRHIVNNPDYQKVSPKVRMNIMRAPKTGKVFFELVSLAVSSISGCEACIRGHEKALIDAGVKIEKISSSIRVAGIVASIGRIVTV